MRLELLLLADVALIGMPNAGKSSLLRRLSRAHPAVASYPFTTVEPVLGAVEIGDTSFAVVEIPGLIRGSHKGLGLGHEFLKHAQRSRLFVHVLDLSEQDPLVNYELVREEVGLFDPAMARRPEVVVANKMDLPEARSRLAVVRRRLEGSTRVIYPLSAATGEGVAALLNGLVALVKEERGRGRATLLAEAQGPPAQVAPRGRQRDLLRVERASDTAFRVVGKRAERLANGTDLRRWQARVQLWRELQRMGVGKALEKAGAGPGARVLIGDKELEWP